MGGVALEQRPARALEGEASFCVPVVLQHCMILTIN
jgi:hypothetical protein